MYLSTKTEAQLINLVAHNKCVDECKIEWMNRWGLEFPLIRTPFGIIRYGECHKA